MVQGKKQLNSKPKFAEVVIGDNEANEMCESTNVRNHRQTVKVQHRESDGLTLYVRKLSEGRFQIPRLNDDNRTITLTPDEFTLLILGESLALWVEEKAWVFVSSYTC